MCALAVALFVITLARGNFGHESLVTRRLFDDYLLDNSSNWIARSWKTRALNAASPNKSNLTTTKAPTTEEPKEEDKKDEAKKVSEGITGFMFVCTSLVQFMIPGLALFYAGLSGGKSAVSIMMNTMSPLGFVFILWVIFVFSLSFGEPWLQIAGYKLLGNPLTYPFYTHVGIYGPLQRASKVVASYFPGMLFATFQGMFAVITPALIAGAGVDRLRFIPFSVFISLWSIFVYGPLCYWNWGGGWMFQIGAWDFAGGLVVHEAAGFSSLAVLLVVGPRVFRPGKKPPKNHSLPLVMLGTAMMWFGWFGFNSGSALTAGGLATVAFVNTQLAPSVALLTWLGLDRIFLDKPTFTGACFGVITGLVVITPCAGFIQPSMALLAGFLGTVVCYFAVWQINRKTNIDDTHDTIGVHGVGGFLGTILVGCLSDPAECLDRNIAPPWCANPGTVSRSFQQTMIQLVCASVSALWSFGVSYALLHVVFMFTPRLTTYEEQCTARDALVHGELAYIARSRDSDSEHSDDEGSSVDGSNGVLY